MVQTEIQLSEEQMNICRLEDYTQNQICSKHVTHYRLTPA